VIYPARHPYCCRAGYRKEQTGFSYRFKKWIEHTDHNATGRGLRGVRGISRGGSVASSVEARERRRCHLCFKWASVPQISLRSTLSGVTLSQPPCCTSQALKRWNPDSQPIDQFSENFEGPPRNTESCPPLRWSPKGLHRVVSRTRPDGPFSGDLYDRYRWARPSRHFGNC
jgi:hypothetical protein